MSKKKLSNTKKNISGKRNTLLFIVGVFSFLLFANTIPNDYNLDDELVTINHRLTSKGITSIPEIFTSPYYSDVAGNKYEYRPITLSSFAIEHQFFGENPHVSHFFNVLLYVIICMLLFVLLSKLLKEYNYILPLLITLLFVSHPLHTEVVAGIKNRDEILCLLGGLSSLYFSLKFTESKKWHHYILFIVFFGIGILSKRSILPFSIIIPLTLIFFTEIKIRSLLLISFPLVISSSLFLPFGHILYQALIAVALFLLPVLMFLIKEKLNTLAEQKSKLNQNVEVENSLFKNKAFKINMSSGYQLLLVILSTIAALILTYYDLKIPLIGINVFVIVFFLFTHKENREFIYSGLLINLGIASFFYQLNGLPILMLLSTIGLLFIGEFNWKSAINLVLSFIILLFAENESPWVYSLMTIPFIGMFYLFFKKGKTLLITLSFLIFIFFEGTFFLPIDLKYISLIGVFLILSFLHFTRKRLYDFSTHLFLIFLIPVLISGFFIKGWDHLPGFQTKKIDIAVNEVLKSQPNAITVPSSGRELNFVEMPLNNSDAFSIRAGTSLVVLGKYLKLLFLPHPLGFYYGYAEIEPMSITQINSLLSLSLYSFLVLLALLMYRKHPVFTYGIVFYLISISIFSNLFAPIAGMMGDRLSFVASVGFCISFVYMILLLLKANIKVQINSQKQMFEKRVVYVFVIILFAYSAKTFSRNLQWKDTLTLMRADINYLEQSVQANNLFAANILKKTATMKFNNKREDLLNEAVKYSERAVKIYPRADFAWFNLASAYQLLNKPEKASIAFLKAAEIDTSYYEAWKSAGLIFSKQKKYDKAILCYSKMIALDSSQIQAFNSLSESYFFSGNINKSIEINLLAAEKFTDNYEPYVNIGKTYYSLGDKKNALEYFQKAFLINNSDENLRQIILKIKSQSE